MPRRQRCDPDANSSNLDPEIGVDASPEDEVIRLDEGDGETVQRYDFTPIGAPSKTQQGFLKFQANLSRVGVLTYRKHDGSMQRELRPPDEVFDSASLASLAGAPVTDLHSAMVNPSNVRQLQMGIVGESVRHDSQFIQGQVTVQDQGLIDKINAGDRKEGSPGYTCRLDRSAGDFNGEHYDAIQRNIRYNHWALGPENWGRQGADVALRLDGDDAVSLDNPPTAGEPPKEIDEMTTPIKRTVRIDGIDYSLDSAEAQQAINQAIVKFDAAETAQKKALSELQGKFDALTKERDELKKKLDESNDPNRVDSLVSARAELLASARKVLGEEEKLDGLSTREIQVKTLKKLDDKFDDKDRDDAYVSGAFDHSVSNYKPETRRDGVSGTRVATPTPGKKLDKGEQEEVDKYDAGAARTRMEDRNANAWQKGLDKETN